MNRPMRNVLIGFVVVCLLVGILWFSHQRQAPKAQSTSDRKGTEGPVASVKVTPLKISAISTAVSAYGEVVPAPGAIQVVSVPYESRVLRIMVSGGQKVSADDMLVEIEPSPDTLLRLEQARDAKEIAGQKLEHVKKLFELKLATNAQLLQAQEAAQQASLRLESLKGRGVDGRKLIRAGVTGLIGKVYVQEGAIVPAGGALMDVVAQNRLEVRLNLEPEDVYRVRTGQPVGLTYVNMPASEGITGKIRKISQAINPASRLVDVFVALPESSRFLLGEYILGRITVASSRGLVVPRNAVLPEDDSHVLFTIQRGHAVKHIVEVGLESAGEIEISGSGLGPGDMVVVEGNYELEDGMAVKVETPR